MLYGVKCREKGSKEVFSVIFEVETKEEFNEKLKAFIDDEDNNIDKRTVSWAGNSIPLKHTTEGPLVLSVNLDEVT